MMREALEVCQYMKAERHYAPIGMSEDEIVEELKRNPHMLAEAMGGQLASEALEKAAQLLAGNAGQS